jgi:hypothetical protein
MAALLLSSCPIEPWLSIIAVLGLTEVCAGPCVFGPYVTPQHRLSICHQWISFHRLAIFDVTYMSL